MGLGLAKRAERISLETLASATTVTVMSCWQHILLKTSGMPVDFTYYNFAAAVVIQACMYEEPLITLKFTLDCYMS